MIVRMSKIEIVGAKELLQDVLSRLRDLGIFQIEPAAVGILENGKIDDDIRSFTLDEKTMFERVFLEELRTKVGNLLSRLPKLPVRKSYLDPRPVIDTLSAIVERHTAAVSARNERSEVVRTERVEMERYALFLGALAPLVGSARETPDLEFIGLTIREPDMVGRLKEAISRMTDWKYELVTEAAKDGTLVGLITVEKELAGVVKKTLIDEQVPELSLPASFSGFSFPEKVAYVQKRIAEATREIDSIEASLAQFACRWIPIYRSVREWIDDRLSLLSATTAVFETRMCFFITGWMPQRDVAAVRDTLKDVCQGNVVVAEKEIREEDIDRVPIILKNPPYFKPFELFTSLLPLPAYTSYDPTPFIGIFFPIFFGMILGDAGYGLFLGICSYLLMRKFRRPGMVREGAKILLIASLYSIFFGILFGEFFGDLPERLFHLKPICIERREAVIPMLYFALAVGVSHILLG